MKKNVLNVAVLALGITGMISVSSCKNNDSNRELEEGNRMDSIDTTDNNNNSYPTNATAEYLSYVERGGSMDDQQTRSVQTKQALDKLAAAVQEKSQNLKAKPSDSLNAIAHTEDMDNTTERDTSIVADTLYTKGKVIVGVLENLQKDSFPELSEDIEDLKNSWNKLKSAKKTDYKDAAVSSFFKKAADVLGEMDTNVPNSNVSAEYISTDSTRYSKKADTIQMKK